MSVAGENNLPLVVLGGVSEPGGAAEELASLLHLAGERFLHVDELHCQPRAVYIIASNDARYAEYAFASGTVVVDPFDYIPSRSGVRVFRPKTAEIEPYPPDFGQIDPEF